MPNDKEICICKIPIKDNTENEPDFDEFYRCIRYMCGSNNYVVLVHWESYQYYKQHQQWDGLQKTYVPGIFSETSNELCSHVEAFLQQNNTDYTVLVNGTDVDTPNKIIAHLRNTQECLEIIETNYNYILHFGHPMLAHTPLCTTVYADSHAKLNLRIAAKLSAGYQAHGTIQYGDYGMMSQTLIYPYMRRVLPHSIENTLQPSIYSADGKPKHRIYYRPTSPMDN